PVSLSTRQYGIPLAGLFSQTLGALGQSITPLFSDDVSIRDEFMPRMAPLSDQEKDDGRQ
ncbi:hypothetical protein N9C39_10710, partial [Luminiphilus sp.]|nr:hypothetical protein [Luminiphilus sp.]